MRQLKIEEVIDMNKRQQLWEMMRNDVSEDEDDFEWPDWAKDWPRDVTNFGLIKTVFIGAIGPGRFLPVVTAI